MKVISFVLKMAVCITISQRYQVFIHFYDTRMTVIKRFICVIHSLIVVLNIFNPFSWTFNKSNICILSSF